MTAQKTISNLSELPGFDDTVERELAKCLKSMADPNYPEKAGRSLTIAVNFKPDGSGSFKIVYGVKSKLPAEESRAFNAWADKGKIVLNDPKQLTLDGHNLAIVGDFRNA